MKFSIYGQIFSIIIRSGALQWPEKCKNVTIFEEVNSLKRCGA